MRVYPFLVVLLGSLCGCAHERFVQGHGDVGQFVLNQAVAWGGRPVNTNSLPSLHCRWRYSRDEHGVVIHLPRDQYPVVADYLQQVFGKPQFGPVDTTDGCKLGSYRLTPRGGGIQFTYDSKDTQVLVIRPFGQSEGAETR